ncbi:DUF484 family protein [Marinospirillum perlucidum]|uniref:DUF484 family protein n=1 Tax=Marinospirillum perlucidum TaxID=1982602 RepID=UPI000DF43245|nr:DUF484 family protein [Marinospirillum perlucidum]
MMDAEEVVDWLRENPDFFKGREELLCSLELDHPCGDAESLLTYQLGLLREQVRQQEENYQQLLANARDNEKRLRRTERLLINLVETENSEELISVLSERLQQDFQIPEVLLWSYTNLNSLNRADESLQKQQLDLLGNRQALCTQLDTSTARCLGLKAETRGSAALCLLSHTRPLGLLVLVHPDSDKFGQQQDTLFIEYLGSIISRLLAKDRRSFAAQQHPGETDPANY